MTFAEAVKSGFRNYTKFEGVAKRSEYWWWQLFANLLALPYVIAINAGAAIPGAILAIVLGGPILIPSLAVEVRRLRDIGYSWKLMFLKLIPYVGNLIVLLMCIKDSGTATRARLAKEKRVELTGNVAGNAAVNPVVEVEKTSKSLPAKADPVPVANFCPECGSKTAGSKFCSNCGAKLN